MMGNSIRYARLAVAAVLLGLAGCAAGPEPATSNARPLTGITLPKPGSFLALSDVHYDGNAADQWGRNHETSKILWSRAQAEAQRIVAADDPGFILYLGDLPAHNMPQSVRATQFKAVLDGLQGLVAGTQKRLLFLPGNNDSDGEDYCAFTTGGATPFDAASDPAAWPMVNAQLGDIIDASQLARGFYAAYPLGKPGAGRSGASLRLLALNTVIFNPNYGVFGDGTCVDAATRQADANAQLEWLSVQLAATRAAGDRVMLAMHVPPGTDGYSGYPNWNPSLLYTGKDAALAPYVGKPVQDAYLGLVAAYRDEITGTMSSHTHLGDMRRLRDCAGAMSELDLSIPAITTDHGSNPAMQLFGYDARYEWMGRTTRFASEATGKDWAAANRFDFAANYPCTSCTGGETMAQRVAKIDDADLLAGMLEYLNVKRGVGSGPNYAAAMDVRCSS